MYIYARELRNPRVKHAPDSLTLLASGVLSKTRQAFKNECWEHIRLVEVSVAALIVAHRSTLFPFMDGAATLVLRCTLRCAAISAVTLTHLLENGLYKT